MSPLTQGLNYRSACDGCMSEQLVYVSYCSLIVRVAVSRVASLYRSCEYDFTDSSTVRVVVTATIFTTQKHFFLPCSQCRHR